MTRKFERSPKGEDCDDTMVSVCFAVVDVFSDVADVEVELFFDDIDGVLV